VNKLFPLTLAATSAQITAFQHIILVIQENRTPDNLFQGLCTSPSACSTAPSNQQYNIELSTQPWLDKSAPGGTTLPHSVPLGRRLRQCALALRLRRAVRQERQRRVQDGRAREMQSQG
jgi:hypothetical protein